MNLSQLPPQPDRHTGEPRPPSAPLESGETGKATDRRAPSRPIEPPAGEGPLLEWFHADRSSRMMTGLILSVLIVLVYVTKDWIHGHSGLSWVGIWWLWLIPLPWPFVYLLVGNQQFSAGADWLATRRGFVKTYELVKVKIVITSGGFGRLLEVSDAYGRAIGGEISDLQQNPQLWDLVYNGLIHSVHVNGAETNKRARQYLLLDYPPTVTT